MSEANYQVHCDCGAVSINMQGPPKVKAYCHCEDCRSLLQIPYHSVCAWDADKVNINQGHEYVRAYHHPTKNMARYFCTQCGESLYNTNKMGWKLVSQLLIRKRNNSILPTELHSSAHFFYTQRIIDIDDSLPKQN